MCQHLNIYSLTKDVIVELMGSKLSRSIKERPFYNEFGVWSSAKSR